MEQLLKQIEDYKKEIGAVVAADGKREIGLEGAALEGRDADRAINPPGVGEQRPELFGCCVELECGV